MPEITNFIIKNNERAKKDVSFALYLENEVQKGVIKYLKNNIKDLKLVHYNGNR